MGRKKHGLETVILDKPCPYKGKCCMREKGNCQALNDTKFEDGMCHFQKETADGPFLYDLYLEKENRKCNC